MWTLNEPSRVDANAVTVNTHSLREDTAARNTGEHSIKEAKKQGGKEARTYVAGGVVDELSETLNGPTGSAKLKSDAVATTGDEKVATRGTVANRLTAPTRELRDTLTGAADDTHTAIGSKHNTPPETTTPGTTHRIGTQTALTR